MSAIKVESEIDGLQLQIKIKREEFDEAIKGDKEFSLVKEIYLEIRELQKVVQNIQGKL